MSDLYSDSIFCLKNLKYKEHWGEFYNMPLHFDLVSVETLMESKTETLKCPKLVRDITVGMFHPLPNNQLGQLQTSK